MVGTNDRKEITPEQDADQTVWRLFLLYEERSRIQAKIDWETEAFSRRNPGSVIE